MEVFRLSRKKFSALLSGKGAAIKGARWNSAGVELIYTASNRSLAMAEVAVHFSLATLPSDFMMMTIFIPDTILMQNINIDNLPENWNAFPFPTSTQKIGDQFVRENKFCVLRIPSVVTKGDFNLIINPYHKDFKKIKLISADKFPFDQRIFK